MLETITKIKKPEILSIKAGDMQDIEKLELGTIDVSGDQESKDVVFCVYSAEAGKSYYLQLAHTTNIGFTYSIYRASMAAKGGDIITYLGKQYQKGEQLSGGYLNLAEDQKHATNAYHDTTYETYNNVQQAAEPLYWKSNAQEMLPNMKNANEEFYVNYYILRISWDETVQNNKETDMIYLMAG